jgi:hypothetical protein
MAKNISSPLERHLEYTAANVHNQRLYVTIPIHHLQQNITLPSNFAVNFHQHLEI